MPGKLVPFPIILMQIFAELVCQGHDRQLDEYLHMLEIEMR